MNRKLVLVGAAVVLFLLGIGFLLNSSTDRLHAKARQQWKDSAIVEIARRAGDTNWVATEMQTVRKQVAQEPADPEAWFTQHLIVLTNGEWIAYSSKCSKEDRRIHDIFIGLGSDGRWHYSTFHFCIGMLQLRIQEPSASLAEFRQTYFLQEFDGHSDECLRKTWPPERR